MADFVRGTVIPNKLVPLIGLFVVRFSAMESEMNRLIWHVAGLSETAGRAVTASIPNYYPRARLLEWLSQEIADPTDSKKVKKLADSFMKIGDFRNRLIHDEAHWYSHNNETVGMWQADIGFVTRKPTEVSEEAINYYSALSWEVQARMQQYSTKNSVWSDDAHFPWHSNPPKPPQKTTFNKQGGTLG
ncbi:hypothetical protein [Mesorhizobium sp. B2-8-9]|uniref:hypothetical protein n=1 Tax=Mesorhizobium sp. B2-8-9 TaxID=2589899 RepID=UPI00112D363E|nr:hypothetical protein [Mesorhizobium sp. B2-8-9]TPI78090.1 hypothetical protein FJ423_17250 [Mesorhizobium sp. B2-8-9]